MNSARINQIVVKAMGLMSKISTPQIVDRVAALDHVIDRCVRELEVEGVSEEEIRCRLFVLCAYCDEVVLLGSSGETLPRYSQVRKRFGSAQAGVDFYNIAADLEVKKSGAYMLYWLAFRCGFRGQLEGMEKAAYDWELHAREHTLEIAKVLPHYRTDRYQPPTLVNWSRCAAGLALGALAVYAGSLVWVGAAL